MTFSRGKVSAFDEVARVSHGTTGEHYQWLHYLVLKLLYSKRLRPPSTRKKAVGEGRIESPTGYDEQECYDCLVEVERLLGQHINLKFKVQKGSRKTVAPLTNPESAQDVVAYAEQRGWIR